MCEVLCDTRSILTLLLKSVFLQQTIHSILLRGFIQETIALINPAINPPQPTSSLRWAWVQARKPQICNGLCSLKLMSQLKNLCSTDKMLLCSPSTTLDTYPPPLEVLTVGSPMSAISGTEAEKGPSGNLGALSFTSWTLMMNSDSGSTALLVKRSTARAWRT